MAMPTGIVSAAAEHMVTVGILLPATTRDEQDGDPTTSGHSSWLSPGKFDRPVMHGLVGVRNKTSSGLEGGEYVFGINTFRGCPVMGLKLYSTGIPTIGSWWAKVPECKMRVQTLRESWVVGPKA